MYRLSAVFIHTTLKLWHLRTPAEITNTTAPYSRGTLPTVGYVPPLSAGD